MEKTRIRLMALENAHGDNFIEHPEAQSESLAKNNFKKTTLS